eukprot:943863_1
MTSVATYAVFMQVTILFIVMVRYFCLNKAIKSAQLLSVCISVFGMVVFELVELEPKIMDETQSVLTDDSAKSDMIGIGLMNFLFPDILALNNSQWYRSINCER